MDSNKRHSSSFQTKKDARRYWVLVICFYVLAILSSIGLLVYKNPVPVDSPSFFPVVKRRLVALVAMLIAASCQSLATISFQTVTSNRLITPSLLGFEAIYSMIQTAVIYFYGQKKLVEFTGTGPFLLQIAIMVLVCVLIFGFMLTSKGGNIQFMLLIGIIFRTGFQSLSAFMRRLLTPSEFDLLQTKLYASVNNAEPEYFKIAIPAVIICMILLYANSRKLNVISLGRDVAINLGINYKVQAVVILVIISILMAISTALVGPMTFFGLLVASLTYQLAPTYDHKYLFIMGLGLAYLVLTGAYFLMNHVLPLNAVVSVVIELFGGLFFLILILRKGVL